jgi:acyl dehydratase
MPDLGDHAFDNRIADMTGKTWAYEDFVEGASLDLGTKHVSAAEIIEFASEFDAQPMHLDEAAGKASILGGLSASGWHTCAMFMRMMCDAFLLDSTAQGAPGVDHVKWKKPVLAGDTLSGKLTILGKRQSRSRPQVGLVSMRAELFNQHGENVFELENTAMFLTREAAA